VSNPPSEFKYPIRLPTVILDDSSASYRKQLAFLSTANPHKKSLLPENNARHRRVYAGSSEVHFVTLYNHVYGWSDYQIYGLVRGVFSDYCSKYRASFFLIFSSKVYNACALETSYRAS
jgi:hypothetical protein